MCNDVSLPPFQKAHLLTNGLIQQNLKSINLINKMRQDLNQDIIDVINPNMNYKEISDMLIETFLECDPQFEFPLELTDHIDYIQSILQLFM